MRLDEREQKRGQRHLLARHTQTEITCSHQSATPLNTRSIGRSPWYASGLQHVGNAHVPGPDVKLPFLQAQHPTQDRARVDPDSHVHVKVQLFPYVPGDQQLNMLIFYTILLLPSLEMQKK